MNTRATGKLVIMTTPESAGAGAAACRDGWGRGGVRFAGRLATRFGDRCESILVGGAGAVTTGVGAAPCVLSVMR